MWWRHHAVTLIWISMSAIWKFFRQEILSSYFKSLQPITAMTNDHPNILIHLPLDCLFSSLCRMKSKETSQLHIISFLWRESTGDCPDSKVHGANMGPTWVLSAPAGPHVGPINLAIRVVDSLHKGTVMQIGVSISQCDSASDAIWHKWSISSFVHVMVCHLFDTKPSPEPVMS